MHFILDESSLLAKDILVWTYMHAYIVVFFFYENKYMYYIIHSQVLVWTLNLLLYIHITVTLLLVIILQYYSYVHRSIINQRILTVMTPWLFLQVGWSGVDYSQSSTCLCGTRWRQQQQQARGRCSTMMLTGVHRYPILTISSDTMAGITCKRIRTHLPYIQFLLYLAAYTNGILSVHRPARYF